MTKSLAEEELNQFVSSFKRIYRYKQEFIPDHYITITKISKIQGDGSSIEEFEIIQKESTTNIEEFNKELFLKLLIKEELIYNDNHKWYMDVRDFRTQGCNCGAWATSNPEHHSNICSKKVRYGAGHE